MPESSEDAPPILYHYTSAAAFLSILSSRTLWASHIGYLADMWEMRRAMMFAQRACTRLMKRTRLAREHLMLLNAFVEVLDRPETVATYVVSFSAKPDHLSQWREYCPPPGGCAIGFRTTFLQALASDQAFSLGPCQYRSTAQFRTLYVTLASLLRAETPFSIQSMLDNARASGSDEAELDVARAILLPEIARAGAFMKQPGFAEEHEWRLVSALRFQGVLYRSPTLGPPGSGSSRRVAPYLKFHLSKRPTFRADQTDEQVEAATNVFIHDVVVGPSSDKERARHAVRAALRDHGQGCEPRSCTAPFVD